MDKWTLLHRAVQGEHVGVALVLLEHGADANTQTVYKWTPFLASQGEHMELSWVLIEHSADVNAQGIDKFTPLHLTMIHLCDV